jgi:hypothetical protein
MKTAVCTTFPLDYYNVCAREMIVTFDKHWPKDVDLFIALDKVSKEELAFLHQDIGDILKSGREFFISNQWTDEKEAFYKRNQDSPDVSYRFHVCKFAHKVFALKGVADHCRQLDYTDIIWLDADVITKADYVPEDMGANVTKLEIYDAATLQRIDAPHSECSFIQFSLEGKGGEIIDKMHNCYVTDEVLMLAGWTDCDVFDHVAKNYCVLNLSEGIKGWHVFPESKLGKYMEHRKGNRKHVAKTQNIMQPNEIQRPIVADTMTIKTMNCIPHEQIIANIKENLKQIKKWVEYVKPHDETVVICSAGESLSYCDVKKWADKGTKIVTVKHAIDRLKAWGIKPWACVLLDPRQHVEKFINTPDKDVIYFVASMVDPSVVKTLLDNNCIVIGYHAMVGAGEEKILDKGTMLVSGGSATATRCLGVLHECLGFSDIHCYGYDLCYFTKPDMNKRDDAGNLKYMEITLAAKTWGGKLQQRTFWTEGQFLAQAKELHDLYKTEQGFNMVLHGNGIPSWQRACFEQYKAWVDQFNSKIDQIKQNSVTLQEWENGIRAK